MARQEDDPGLPIKFGPCCNAEYDPEPLSPFLDEVIRRAREACERNARRVAMSRREFLLPVCGAATTLAVLDACTRQALGIPTVCTHKGFSGGSRFANPADVGPAAQRHPDVNFVVYHSGFEARTPEGPYTAARANVGVNRLITSMRRAGNRTLQES